MMSSANETKLLLKKFKGMNCVKILERSDWIQDRESAQSKQ